MEEFSHGVLITPHIKDNALFQQLSLSIQQLLLPLIGSQLTTKVKMLPATISVKIAQKKKTL